MIEAKRANVESFEEPEIFVGKDVLEILSSSMYVNRFRFSGSMCKTPPTPSMMLWIWAYCLPSMTG